MYTIRNKGNKTELRKNGKVLCYGNFSTIADLCNRLSCPVMLANMHDCGMIPDFMIDVFAVK